MTNTLSHGIGHYGPAFFDYFYGQNEAIANGTANGTQLIMDSLGIINGIIDASIQMPYYPEFAVNNTYGIKAYNDTICMYLGSWIRVNRMANIGQTNSPKWFTQYQEDALMQ